MALAPTGAGAGDQWDVESEDGRARFGGGATLDDGDGIGRAFAGAGRGRWPDEDVGRGSGRAEDPG